MKEQIDLTYFAAHPEICHPQAEELQRSVAWETLSTRGVRGFKQYGKYFLGMWGYGLAYPDEARLIRSAYFWFRHVDDIADRDKSLPEGYESRQEFAEEKKLLAKRLFFQPDASVYGDKEDVLLADYYSIARKMGISLGDESLAILDTIILDEERARHKRILTQQELTEYFDKLDFACIGGALKVPGETRDSSDLSALSWAVRTMFNLRDFPRDFAQGIINISKEDLGRYGVDLAQVERRETVEQLVTYEPMRRWYEDQTRAGGSFLKEAKQLIPGLHLKWRVNQAIGVFFVQPSERTLNKYAKMLAA